MLSLKSSISQVSIVIIVVLQYNLPMEWMSTEIFQANIIGLFLILTMDVSICRNQDEYSEGDWSVGDVYFS
jgi:hypothetical protein